MKVTSATLPTGFSRLASPACGIALCLATAAFAATAQTTYPTTPKHGIAMPLKGGVEDWGVTRPRACDLSLAYARPVLARHEGTHPQTVQAQRNLMAQVEPQLRAASPAAMLQSAKLNSADATTGGRWYGLVLQTATDSLRQAQLNLNPEALLQGIRAKDPNLPTQCPTPAAPTNNLAAAACSAGAQLLQVLVQTELLHQQICVLEGLAQQLPQGLNLMGIAPAAAPTAPPVAPPPAAPVPAPAAPSLSDQCGKRVFLAREKCFAELCAKPENKEAWECKRRERNSP